MVILTKTDAGFGCDTFPIIKYSLHYLFVYILQSLRPIGKSFNTTSLISEEPIQAILKLMISNRESRTASFSVLLITKLKCRLIQNKFYARDVEYFRNRGSTFRSYIYKVRHSIFNCQMFSDIRTLPDEMSDSFQPVPVLRPSPMKFGGHEQVKPPSVLLQRFG
jgi:hypothetical protein